MERLSDAAETHIDLDGLLTLARAAAPLAEGDALEAGPEGEPERQAVIAVARDEAFALLRRQP